MQEEPGKNVPFRAHPTIPTSSPPLHRALTCRLLAATEPAYGHLPYLDKYPASMCTFAFSEASST